MIVLCSGDSYDMIDTWVCETEHPLHQVSGMSCNQAYYSPECGFDLYHCVVRYNPLNFLVSFIIPLGGMISVFVGLLCLCVVGGRSLRRKKRRRHRERV